MTLYVRTDGDDSNDGLTESTALATIQEAVDRVPKFVEHNVTIDIGEGSFKGAQIANFVFGKAKTFSSQEHIKFTIEGKLGNPSLSTGSVSGVATSGDQISLTDSSQDWTTNELRGMFCKIGEDYRLIRENTATTLTFGAKFSTSTSGKDYEVFEPKTTINDFVSADNNWWDAGLNIQGLVSNDWHTGRLYIRNLKTDGSDSVIWPIGINITGANSYLEIQRVQLVKGQVGVWVDSAWSVHLYEGYMAENNSAGVFLYMTVGTWLTASRIGAYNNKDGLYCHANANTGDIDGFFDSNTRYGVYAFGSPAEIDFETDLYIKGNGSHGIKLENVSFLDLDNAIIEDNGGYGIYIDENASGNRVIRTFANLAGNITIQNNTLGGIIAKNHSVVALTNCTGSGNGGYGLELQTKSYATITSQTSVTGDSGDLTIDDGKTVLSYSSDFANNGDTVTNLYNGCRIERRD